MSELYNKTVLDHYRNPRNVGVLEGADAVGKAENSACGDILHLYLKIHGARVTDCRFKTFGCAAAIAAGSRLTELVKGATVEEVRRLRRQDVVDALGGLPPMKIHCSVLAEDVIRAALADFDRR